MDKKPTKLSRNAKTAIAILGGAIILGLIIYFTLAAILVGGIK